MADGRAPMKARRRVPGMPSLEESGEKPAPGLMAVASPAPEAPDRAAMTEEAPLERAERPAVEEEGTEDVVAPRAPLRRSRAARATASATADEKAGADVNPYTGAGTTSLTVRVVVPLHARYRRLVRDLEDEGYRTSSTELFHALLHFGPKDTDEARDLLRRWRSVLDADPLR